MIPEIEQQQGRTNRTALSYFESGICWLSINFGV